LAPFESASACKLEPPLELSDRHQLEAATPDPTELGRDVLIEEVAADPQRPRRLVRRQS
jgi:hypothetical protein